MGPESRRCKIDDGGGGMEARSSSQKSRFHLEKIDGSLRRLQRYKAELLLEEALECCCCNRNESDFYEVKRNKNVYRDVMDEKCLASK